MHFLQDNAGTAGVTSTGCATGGNSADADNAVGGAVDNTNAGAGADPFSTAP